MQTLLSIVKVLKRDISLLAVNEFLFEMKKVAEESFRVLKKGKMCAVTIGDVRKYGKVIPLSFRMTECFLQAGFTNKEIIIKEQHNCRSTDYWRKQNNDFLLLAHEYIFVFKKYIDSQRVKVLIVIWHICKYNRYVKDCPFGMQRRGIKMSDSSIAPFVKWAGGKRQLLPQIKERMPEQYNNYFEPFVGGGAVIFALLPASALINDINKALINTYKQIQNVPEAFLKAVNKLDEEMWEDGKEYYYSIRELYNDKLMKAEFDVELAALFVFINKHCFNGLYRVNGKGLFNVPYNNSRRASIDEKNIMETSEYLKGVTIIDGDFEVACKDAKKGDFVFIDSPYAPLNPTSFESYTKEGFDIESHKRLAKLFDELTARGCYCMLTNHNTDLINELYGGKGYKIDVVSVKRMINSDASNRVGEEVIICNY